MWYISLFMEVHSETFLYLYDQMNTYYFNVLCVYSGKWASSKHWEISVLQWCQMWVYSVILPVIYLYTELFCKE